MKNIEICNAFHFALKLLFFRVECIQINNISTTYLYFESLFTAYVFIYHSHINSNYRIFVNYIIFLINLVTALLINHHLFFFFFFWFNVFYFKIVLPFSDH